MISKTTDARPLQVRVADDIRGKIERGEYKPGQQVPTLDELAESYMCSLAVVRRALDLLRQQGLVITQQGKGSFVRRRPTVRRHGMERYSRKSWSNGQMILVAEAKRQGHTADQLIRELGEVKATARVAEALQLEPGDRVFVRRRTTLINDRPNQLADSYYPLAVVEAAPALKQENTGPGGGYARIDETPGYHLREIEEHLSARMPTGPESAVLELPAGTPVVELWRTTFANDNQQPIEVMHSVIAADMADFTYRFPIPD